MKDFHVIVTYCWAARSSIADMLTRVVVTHYWVVQHNEECYTIAISYVYMHFTNLYGLCIWTAKYSLPNSGVPRFKNGANSTHYVSKIINVSDFKKKETT